MRCRYHKIPTIVNAMITSTRMMLSPATLICVIMLSRVLLWLLCPPSPTVSISVSTFGSGIDPPMSINEIHLGGKDDNLYNHFAVFAESLVLQCSQNHLFTVKELAELAKLLRVCHHHLNNH